MTRASVKDPKKDDRLNLKKPECFHCLNALWRHSPGRYWYPTYSTCRMGDECIPNDMSVQTRIFITGIYIKYAKAGRIRELCK